MPEAQERPCVITAGEPHGLDEEPLGRRVFSNPSRAEVEKRLPSTVAPLQRGRAAAAATAATVATVVNVFFFSLGKTRTQPSIFCYTVRGSARDASQRRNNKPTNSTRINGEIIDDGAQLDFTAALAPVSRNCTIV